MKLLNSVVIFVVSLLLSSPAWADEIKWEPVCNFDSQIFPSFLVATANRQPTPAIQEKFSAKGKGDCLGMIGIKIVCPADNTKIVLRVESDTIMNDGEISCNLEKAGQE